MTQEEIKDIALCGETSTVQFKQEFTSQKEIAKEMIAFANSHGGRIFFGIADKTGELTPKGEATRVGMLFFGKNPQQYEPSVVVKAVAFAGNDIGDTNYLDSRDITGTLPRMFKEGMAFLKSYLHHEQKGQNFNSTGILEIPEVVLEELLQNSLVHFDLLHHAAIRLLIFNDRIEIINPGSLYGGLKIDDIKLGVSRQRNPLMAGFAARTMIYRGLGSGIKRVVRENVRIDFDNEESANQFKVTVWRTVPKDGIKEGNTTQKRSESTQKSTQITADSTLIASSDTQKSTQKASDSTQKRILEIIEETPRASRKDIAERIGISEDGVKKQLANLKRMGLIERVGAARGGYWKIIQV